jgi:hypothetical protein
LWKLDFNMVFFEGAARDSSTKGGRLVRGYGPGPMLLRCLMIGLMAPSVAGCSSEALPPRLSAEQQKAVAAVHFKATVGVRRYMAPVYSDNLIEYLRKTRLFERVDALDAFQTPPTFIAEVRAMVYGTATFPLLTMVSFGVIPSIVDEEHGTVFVLIPTAEPKTPIAVNYKYRGPSMLGWWAMADGALPDRTWGDAGAHPRFIQSLAWLIVTHEKELSAYAN